MQPLTRRRFSAHSDWPEAVTARRRLRARHHGLSLARVDGDDPVACAGGGWLRLEGDDGRVETHGVRAYDRVCVDDGARVEAGRAVLRRHGFRDVVVADVPEGERARVTFQGLEAYRTLREEVDLYTGAMRRFVARSPGADPEVTLAPEAPGAWPSQRLSLPHGVELLCDEATPVTRGALLARALRAPSARAPMVGGDHSLRALFEGAAPHGAPRALVAPVDGRVVVVGVPRGCVGVAHDGGTAVLRRPRRRHALIVFEGMWVHAGDPLTDGSIDHRELAPALGDAGFVAHVAEEMFDVFALQGFEVPEAALELAASLLVDTVTVTDPGDAPLARSQVLPRREAARVAREVAETGGRAPTFATRFEPLSSRRRG